MQNILLIVLIFLLLGSWLIFMLYFNGSRSREAILAKKLNDSRKQLRSQNAGIDSFIDILSGVHEIGTENPTAENREALVKSILDAACQVMKCSVGSLMLIDKQTHELVTVTTKGIPTPSAGPSRLKMGQGIAGKVAESGKAIVVDDADSDTRFLNEKNMEYHLKSLIAVPVKVRERMIGVLSIHTTGSISALKDRNLQLLTILADQSAITIENLDLYNSLQLFYVEMVETLARALEFREYEPSNHPFVDRKLDRIYAREISRELNLPESIIRFIEFASMMHGIGKIGVQEEILRKPGKLTEEEYDQIKRHPEIGQQIISKVKFLLPVVPMILYHQERWDGKGYPAGLKGEEIPLGSRVVAVVNAYQAMVSERPYRAALTELEAIQELKKGSGTQFDPKVVDAFIRILEKGKGKQSENSRDISGTVNLHPGERDQVERS